MKYYYGGIDGPTTLKYVTALEQTGDMHIGIYDWANKQVYLSVSEGICKCIIM